MTERHYDTSCRAGNVSSQILNGLAWIGLVLLTIKHMHVQSGGPLWQHVRYIWTIFLFIPTNETLINITFLLISVLFRAVKVRILHSWLFTIRDVVTRCDPSKSLRCFSLYWRNWYRAGSLLGTGPSHFSVQGRVTSRLPSLGEQTPSIAESGRREGRERGIVEHQLFNGD